MSDPVLQSYLIVVRNLAVGCALVDPDLVAESKETWQIETNHLGNLHAGHLAIANT